MIYGEFPFPSLDSGDRQSEPEWGAIKREAEKVERRRSGEPGICGGADWRNRYEEWMVRRVEWRRKGKRVDEELRNLSEEWMERGVNEEWSGGGRERRWMRTSH